MKEYLTYKSIEFAQDNKFIAWVKGDSTQKLFWDQFLEAYPEKRNEVEEAIQLVQKITFEKKVVSKQKLDSIWKQIDQKTSSSATIPSAIEKTLPRRSFLKPLIGMAASLLLLFGIFQWFNSSTTVQSMASAVGEFKEIVLPDGSKVSLNALSTLEFNEKIFLKDRTLHLNGEAFFEVKKGSTFTVHTEQGSVKVLGTSFNVNTRNGLKVDCFTGKVAVKNLTNKEVILTKGKGVHFTNSNEKKYEFTGDSAIKWKSGIFEFEGATLSTVLDELERQYGVTVQTTDEIRSKIYNGFFTKDNLENALYSICWPMNLESSKDGKVITIKTK